MRQPSHVMTGDVVRLLLRGQQGTHSVTASVEVSDSDSLRIKLPNGRSVAIPASAVITIERRDPTNPASFVPVKLPAPMETVASALDELMTQLLDGENLSELAVDVGVPDMSLAERVEMVHKGVLAATDLVTLPEHVSLLNELEQTTEVLLRRLRSATYPEALELRGTFLRGLRGLRNSCQGRGLSGTLTKRVSGLVDRIETAEQVEWNEYIRRFDARPRIVTAGVATINVDSSGEFVLPVRVTLDDAYLPAKHVTVVFDKHRGVEVVGHPPVVEALESGATVNLNVRMADRRRQGARDDLKIEGHLTYAGLNNETRHTARQKLTIRLRRSASYKPITNPFRDYASGIPVDNPGMFFGRETIIQEIVSHLSDPRSGRCYALYGQKRTGKSSALEQVRRRLEDEGVIVAVVPMGTIDRAAITVGFVSHVLDQYREQVGEQLSPQVFKNLLTRWPDSTDVEREPLRSFRKARTAARALLKAQGLSEPRFAIVVDEFTYLFEVLRRSHVSPAEHDQLRDFMRHWKGLLEAKLLSALVVGQDTMPHFLRAFPNEFSVMHTERLDYLTAEETERLADDPIRNDDGTSRFAGYALSAVPMYTDGHPFFTQIVCDRIVTVANEERRTEIAEFDVEAAIETLLAGPREIDFHRFDCLLSADNTGTLLSELGSEGTEETSSEVALRVLHRLARIAGGQNTPVHRDRLQLTTTEERVYRDLVVRQVITEREGSAQIRVLLFAEYLRRMAA
jgi:hypothetical protein